MDNYFVVVTHGSREIEVSEKIAETWDDKADVYLPIVRVKKFPKHRKSKKPVIVKRPMYPRYVFVRLSNQDEWGEIQRINGVYGLLLGDNGPLTVKPRDIDQVKEIEQIIAQDRDPSTFKTGDKVKISKDHEWWGGLSGIFRNDGKVDVIVDQGKVVKMDIPSSMLDRP